MESEDFQTFTHATDTLPGDTVVHSAWPLPEFASKIQMTETMSISFQTKKHVKDAVTQLRSCVLT